MDGEASRHYNLECMLQDQSAKPCDLPLQYLKDITKDFSDERELGRGGFGVVYKGVLQNGEVIAVKKLVFMLEVQEKQFKNEVDHLMRFKHKNIVRFLGYCYETRQKYIEHNGKYFFAEMPERLLCFEYLPNGTLEKHLSDESCGLDWHKRYKIIEGICQGLHYLHEEWQINTPVIHLDLKPANILLDDNMVPKIADFGLSKLFGSQQTRICTTTLEGSFGYMAPEYLHKGIITTKSDIFSLGVIVIEIMTGQKNYPYGTGISLQDFVELVLKNWRNRLEAIPKYTSLEIYYQQIKRCIEIGLNCVETDPMKRPTTRQIIEKLNRRECTNMHLSNDTRSSVNQIRSVPKELLGINPLELCFCFELNKQISCFVQLTNKTDDCVAFYFVVTGTTSRNKYNVLPRDGLVLPRSMLCVIVTMEAQQEKPMDMQCNDKFLVQSVIVKEGSLTTKNITVDMFNKMSGNVVDEVELPVVYVRPPQLSSLLSVGSKEDLPSSSGLEKVHNHEETKTNNQLQLGVKKLGGTFSEENGDLLINFISQDLGFSNGRPIAACLIYRCLLHWRSFEAERTAIFDYIIQTIDTAITADDDSEGLAYWLSNASTLLSSLQRALETTGRQLPHRRRSSAASLFGRMSVGLQASPQSGLGNHLQVKAKYPALLFKQQLTAYVEKMYSLIRENLKKDTSALLGLCFQAPRTSRARQVKASRAHEILTKQLIEHWQCIVETFTTYFNILKANYVQPFLVRKLFTQVFSFVNVQLFNNLLCRRECCSLSNGEYLKAGLTLLEQWCIDVTEEYSGSSWDELKHIRQATVFLVIHQKPRKTFKEITNDLCPALSIQQLYRIITMYWDDIYGTHSVSSEVISSMKMRMAEDSNNAASSSFLLDDDTSIPFSVDDIRRAETAIEVTDVEMPHLICENSSFSFLHERKD